MLKETDIQWQKVLMYHLFGRRKSQQMNTKPLLSCWVADTCISGCTWDFHWPSWCHRYLLGDISVKSGCGHFKTEFSDILSLKSGRVLLFHSKENLGLALVEFIFKLELARLWKGIHGNEPLKLTTTNRKWSKQSQKKKKTKTTTRYKDLFQLGKHT